MIVGEEALRGTYGMQVKKQYKDLDPIESWYYRPWRFELGTQLKVDASVKVNDNFSYTTQLVLFSNYLRKPQNIRVNWDNRMFWKLAKYFALTVSTNLIYDDTIRIPKDDKHDYPYRAIQFKEFLEFGFTYTIASKKP